VPQTICRIVACGELEDGAGAVLDLPGAGTATGTAWMWRWTR
jgi:hypothetical protein